MNHITCRFALIALGGLMSRRRRPGMRRDFLVMEPMGDAGIASQVENPGASARSC
jgi:hypothetical protein